MSRLRAILFAGACSVALSGCLPAAAGLALTAASLVSGGDGDRGRNFRNPIDRQSTGQQVRQALSRLDDQVDPACQAILDERLKTHGTLTADVDSRPGTTTDTAAAAPSSSDEPPPPDDPLTKKGRPADAATDRAVSADTDAPAPDAALQAGASSGGAPDGIRPVKASLGTGRAGAAPAPGACEHRWTCLPGTSKPTIMLMCPGKGGDTSVTDAMAADGAAETSETSGTSKDAESERKTATVEPGNAADGNQAAAGAKPAPRTIRSGGVADWNWTYDPSHRYR